MLMTLAANEYILGPSRVLVWKGVHEYKRLPVGVKHTVFIAYSVHICSSVLNRKQERWLSPFSSTYQSCLPFLLLLFGRTPLSVQMQLQSSHRRALALDQLLPEGMPGRPFSLQMIAVSLLIWNYTRTLS